MDRHPDVIVIGAGIIGSSIAFRLAQGGLRVTVLDRSQPGAEASSAAAGMLAPQGEKTGPEAFAELCWTSHALYPEFVAEAEMLSGQVTGYRRDGTLLVAFTEEQERELVESTPSLARAQSQTPGVRTAPVEPMTAHTAVRLVPGLSDTTRAALFLPADHWVDNERLTAAVVESARRLGVAFVQKDVTRLIEVDGRIRGILAEEERYSAGEFILAAGCWSGDLASSVGLEVPTKPCRGQMIEYELGPDSPELTHVVRAGHHYLVPRAGRKVVAGTTAEYAGFQKIVTAGGLHDVTEQVLRLVPALKDARFVRCWAGLRPDTRDHLPVLGPSGISGLTLATGHFRNGILLAPVTARLIAESVLTGSPNDSLAAFAVDRFARLASAP